MSIKRMLSLLLCALFMVTSVGMIATADTAPTAVNVIVGDSYTLPEMIDGESVTWSPQTVDTSKVGYGLYTGTLASGMAVTYRVNVGEYKALIEDNLEGYNASDYEAAVEKTITGGTFNKVAYSDEADANSSVRLVKEGDNTVIELGTNRTQWGSIAWIPTDAAKDESFKISADFKVVNFDIANSTQGTNYFFELRPYNVECVTLRAKTREGAITATELRYNAGEGGALSNNATVDSYITWNTAEDGKVSMSDYVNVEIVGNSTIYSVYLNGDEIVSELPWKQTAVTNYGVQQIQMSKQYVATAVNALVYADNLVYKKAVYPVGDAPAKISTKVEKDAASEQTTSFNLEMSDGSQKAIRVAYSVDTSVEGTQTVQGTAEGFNFTIPVEVSVEQAPVVIESIDNLAKTVDIGSDFTLPATVIANMSDGSTQEVAITWNKAASTATKGIYTFNGTVEGYNGTVTYTLTVHAVTNRSVIVGRGDEYTLPTSFNGISVTWDADETLVDTTYIGKQIFNGKDTDGTAVILTVNVGEPTILIYEDMESYTVGGDKPDYVGDGGLYLGDGNDIVYEEGNGENNKVAQVSDETSWGDFKLISPETSKYDYIISGRYMQKSDTPRTGVKFVAYNKDGTQNAVGEVAGMYMNMDSSKAGVLNVRNCVHGNANTGVNADALNLQGKAFENWTNKWIDFSIFVNKNTKTYDVIANGHDIRLGVPLNNSGVSDPAFKSIQIVGVNSSVQAYLDDIKVTDYKYVVQDLPEALTDSVVAGVEAEREQYISLKMNDGTMQQFAVKYTIDPEESGQQNVIGRVDGFSETVDVTVDVDARSILSIDAASLSNTGKVYVGSDYVLPTTVTAIMSDVDSSGSNKKEMTVFWDGAASTSEAGNFTFNGTVNGYDDEITYTLTVSVDKPVSAEPITETISINEAFELPKYVMVTMESGAVKSMEAVWNSSSVITDVAGVYEHTGYVTGYPEITPGSGVLTSLTLTVVASAVKAANYPSGEDAFDIILKDASQLPEKISCVYENNMTGFESVEWDTTAIGAGEGPFEIIGTITNDNLVAGFDGTVKANVSFYNVPAPGLEDGLDTYKWPFGDDMFPLGASLIYKHFPPNNSKKFLCVEDPDDPTNKVMRYHNDPSFDENDKGVYNQLKLSEAKDGFLVAEAKIRLPRGFTDVRFRMLTGMSKEFFVADLYGDRSIKLKSLDLINGAFPLNEWFKLTVVTNTTATTQTPTSELYYDIYINDVFLCRAPWYSSPSETNGVGQGVMQFDFRNDKDESFMMYVDDVKLYFLNDLMEEAYTVVNSISTDVSSDSIALPTSVGDTQIVWSSSDESVIKPDGTVIRPAYDSSNKKVVLTAELSQQAGIFAATDTVTTKEITVRKVGATDADMVAAAKSALNLSSETTKDLKLKTSHGSAAITWLSSNKKVIDEEGRVYPVEKDTDVTLTATITCGSVTETKTFTVKVLHTDTLTDLQKVRKAMSSVELPESTSDEVELPTSINGVTVTWISNNLSVINSDGTLVKSRPSSATATLTATFACGDVYETKDYTLTVKNTSSSGSSGGGGGGGRVIKSNAVQSVPTITQTPSVPTEKFTDLAGYQWANEAVYALHEKGIINGVSENLFAPQSNVKREEFAAMIVRLAELKATTFENVFSDVSESDWFFKELMAAYENGIVNGMNDGAFGVGVNITRQDIAVILCNLAKKYGIDTAVEQPPEFSDYNNTSDYAKEAIAFLCAKGVINGSDGKILPLQNATRAEAAKMIYEFIKVFDAEKTETVAEEIEQETVEEETNVEQTE